MARDADVAIVCVGAVMANGTPRVEICRTSHCRAGRMNWSVPWRRRTRAPSSCCKPAVRSRCRGSARSRGSSRPGTRDKERATPIADVLTGVAEPGGRLPQSFPRHWSDNPTHSQDKEIYPGLDGQGPIRGGRVRGLPPLRPAWYRAAVSRSASGSATPASSSATWRWMAKPG